MRRVLLPVAALGFGILSWFAFEGTAPEIAIDEPRGPLPPGSAVSFEVHDDRSGVGEVTVTVDGQEVSVDGAELTLPAGLADGPHEITIVAQDRSLRANEATVSTTVVLDGTGPRFRLAPSSAATAQGRPLPLLLTTDEVASSVSAEVFGRPVTLLKAGGLYLGVAGASVSEESGELTVRAIDALGNESVSTFPVAVEATAFPKGGFVQLSADKEKNQLDLDLRKKDRERRAEGYAVPQPEQLNRGTMLRPIDGPVSSPFGKVREYSSGVVRHHLGTDLVDPRGTPVRASAAGVVSLAEQSPIYGNAVVVRHGPDLSTSYNHLFQLDVTVGQRIARGDVVGQVGSTGQSTGPHLHWGMVAGGVAVAAEAWLERDLLEPTEADRAHLFAPWD